MTTDAYSQSAFLIIKAAYLYYIEDHSQSEIADMLGISIATVSRLLDRAKKQKIVDFVITNPYMECIRLEEELKSRFRLKDVVIAPAVADYDEAMDNGENIKKQVALEAARYLQRTIKKGDVIGITWGSTLSYMVNYLNPSKREDVSVVTLNGTYAYCDTKYDTPSLAHTMAKAFEGEHYSILSNVLMSSKEAADIIKNEKSVKRVYQKFRDINVSVNGIGAFYPETTSILTKSDLFTEEDMREIREQNAVGDIAYHIFDKDGNECRTSLVDRTINIDMETFKKIETKIILASGTHKACSVAAALKGGLIDVLIVDSELARRVLAGESA